MCRPPASTTRRQGKSYEQITAGPFIRGVQIGTQRHQATKKAVAVRQQPFVASCLRVIEREQETPSLRLCGKPCFIDANVAGTRRVPSASVSVLVCGGLGLSSSSFCVGFFVLA